MLSAAPARPEVWIGFAAVGAFLLVQWAQSSLGLADRVSRRAAPLRAAAYAAGLVLLFFGAIESSNQFIYYRF